MFTIYYGFGTWVLCDENGNIIAAADSNQEANELMGIYSSTVVWC